MKWFPNNKGTAMGLVVGGFGGGAFAFNNIQVGFFRSGVLFKINYFFE